MGIQCISSNEKNLELKMKFIITVPELDTKEKYRQVKKKITHKLTRITFGSRLLWVI